MGNFNYQQMRFLIVDNIKPSQEILKQFAMSLTRRQVDSTHYAQDVATICQQVDYDIILLGYDLGDNQKNGQQILEELRINNYISRHCIVILITAEISQEMVLAALEHKPDYYLCKPYSINDLNKRLHKCMQKKVAMATIYQALDNDNPNLVIQECDNALFKGTLYKTECLGIKSRQLFEKKKLSEAKDIYLQYRNTPSCQWARVGLGKIALYQQEFELAEKIFKELITKHPLYLSSYDWLAITYEEQRLFLFAEETLEQALKLSPRSLTRLKKFARLCTHNENFEKAMHAYDKTYRLAKNSIHYSADNAINYTQAFIGSSCSYPLIELKKSSPRVLNLLKQTSRDFREVEVKIHSHLLSACILKTTRDHTLASEELLRGEKLLMNEQETIPEDKLHLLSKTLNSVTQTGLRTDIELPAFDIPVSESVTNKLSDVLFHSSKKQSIKIEAQKALEQGIRLYEQNKYRSAIKFLERALSLYPNHLGIKLHLTQSLIKTYENRVEEDADSITLNKISELLGSIQEVQDEDDNKRLKNLQKKYQQLAGS
jgi:DNA-binding response OmpR family regulator/Tfp pilus assembly protein PilF